MPRINGEMCRAVELLIVPDIAEFSTVGERLAGLISSLTTAITLLPFDAPGIFIINSLVRLAARKVSKRSSASIACTMAL